MNSPKPKDICDYKKWLKEEQSIEIKDIDIQHFEAVTIKIKYLFETSVFWAELIKSLPNYNEDYLLITKGYELFAFKDRPELRTKQYEPFF